MGADRDMGSQQPAGNASEHWRLLGTILWGIAIAVIFVALQVITMLVIVLRRQDGLTEQQVQALLASAQRDGFVLSICTFVTAFVCVPLIVGIAKLKRHSKVGNYLALRRVPVRSLMLWLGILAAFVALSDAITTVLGRPLVPEFMTAVYHSTRPVWLLWVAFVVAAPLFEETFFRGFLYKGFASSFVGPIGAIAITAALWAAIHVQYDLYGIGTTFFLGVLFGLARMLTGSLLTPIGLHAASNIIATAEAAFLG